MPRPLVLFAPLLLLAAPDPARACDFDFVPGTLQAAAGSGQLGFPVGGAESCGPPDQEEFEFAGPLGGTYWEGTGRGTTLRNEFEYSFTVGSGWWGWTPAMMGGFMVPDVVFSGPGPTVDVAVNVALGGTAGGAIPSSHPVSWFVNFRDASGVGGYGSAVMTDSYTPNGPAETATSFTITGVPVGVPVALELRSQWTPHGESSSTTSGTGFQELLDSEVFVLPAGYTADSAEAGIVDNQLMPRARSDPRAGRRNRPARPAVPQAKRRRPRPAPTGFERGPVAAPAQAPAPGQMAAVGKDRPWSTRPTLRVGLLVHWTEDRPWSTRPTLRVGLLVLLEAVQVSHGVVVAGEGVVADRVLRGRVPDSTRVVRIGSFEVQVHGSGFPDAPPTQPQVTLGLSTAPVGRAVQGWRRVHRQSIGEVVRDLHPVHAPVGPGADVEALRPDRFRPRRRSRRGKEPAEQRRGVGLGLAFGVGAVQHRPDRR